MKLSLVIPIYNEEDHLEKFLDLIDNIPLELEKELIIVDDCSKDSSAHIVQNFKFKSAMTFVQQPFNQGKGAALAVGFKHATGQIIGVQDADFEYDPTDIPEILKPLLLNKADVVFGSRFRMSNPQVHRTFHYLINRFLTVLSNLCSGLYLTDMETCYKFFRSEIIQNLELTSKRFGFEPEITAKVSRLKVRMMEVPVSYFPRNYLEGKKITWKDGIAAVRHIFVYNFLARRKNFCKANMPQRYIVKGSQWL